MAALDGDGDVDLLSANATSDSLTLFFQTAAGVFTPTANPLPTGRPPVSVAAATRCAREIGGPTELRPR